MEKYLWWKNANDWTDQEKRSGKKENRKVKEVLTKDKVNLWIEGQTTQKDWGRKKGKIEDYDGWTKRDWATQEIDRGKGKAKEIKWTYRKATREGFSFGSIVKWKKKAYQTKVNLNSKGRGIGYLNYTKELKVKVKIE